MKSDETRTLHWKRKPIRLVIGFLVMAFATSHVAVSDWGAMWSPEHIRVGLEAGLILLVGIGIIRGWGFRD